MLLKLATWSPLLGVLGILLVQALCSAAIIRYFLTTARADFHMWRTFIAPILGAGSMLLSAYLLVVNRETLAGAQDVPFVSLFPWVVPALFVAGVVAAVWFRRRDTTRYEAIGRFVHSEI